jgi:inorganic triphosphatase YgiF
MSVADSRGGDATSPDEPEPTAPTHSLEVERAYDVDDAAVVPDWTRLPGVARVDAPEPRELDARYLDTDDLALARARVALRRRSGGPDAGWHVKASAPDGRHEQHWPLGEDPDEPVPDAVALAVATWAEPPFTPIARIRNHRIAHVLRDASGGIVAEFVDDHVSATAVRAGTGSTWREWEMELGPAAPGDADAFFAAVGALVAEAGGRPAASDSKLQRTLGG